MGSLYQDQQTQMKLQNPDDAIQGFFLMDQTSENQNEIITNSNNDNEKDLKENDISIQEKETEEEVFHPTLLVNLTKPPQAKPGWNAFHYFNFFYRKWNQKSDQPKITAKQVKQAWVGLNQEQKQPFVQLSRKHMNKFQNSPPGRVRQTSAAWSLKKRLSLCDYGPNENNNENWNTWAAHVMKEMITNFHFQFPQLSLKEATHLWKEEWLEMDTDEQRNRLQQWFDIKV